MNDEYTQMLAKFHRAIDRRMKLVKSYKKACDEKGMDKESDQWQRSINDLVAIRFELKEISSK